MRLMAPIWRKVVPPAQILAQDLPGVLDWCVDIFLPQLIGFIEGWRKVTKDPGSPIDVKFLSFESFLERPDNYFDHALEFLGIDRSHFDSAAEAETVHLRKGESEEWRQVFSGSQKERAWKAIPADMASEFGWRR